MLHGNLAGLKPADLKRLERLYRRKVPPRETLSPEVARTLTTISRDLNRQVGLLIERSGRISHVVVGSAKGIFLPDLGEKVKHRDIRAPCRRDRPRPVKNVQSRESCHYCRRL